MRAHRLPPVCDFPTTWGDVIDFLILGVGVEQKEGPFVITKQKDFCATWHWVVALGSYFWENDKFTQIKLYYQND